MDGGDTEYPVPFATFVRTLKSTPDEIWSKLLKQRHGTKNMTPTEWRAALQRLRNE